jgi:hypothetical protein
MGLLSFLRQKDHREPTVCTLDQCPSKSHRYEIGEIILARQYLLEGLES